MTIEILKRILIFILYAGISTYITYNLTWGNGDKDRKREAIYFFVSYFIGVVFIYRYFEESFYRQDLFFALIIILNLAVYKINHIVAILNSIIVFIIFGLGEILAILLFENYYIQTIGLDNTLKYLMAVQAIRFLLAFVFKTFLMNLFTEFIRNLDYIRSNIRNRITISAIIFYLVTNIALRIFLLKEDIIVTDHILMQVIPVSMAILFLALTISHIDLINRFTKSRSRYKSIKEKYITDEMTGALTREEGMKRLEELISSEEKLEVVFIDIDDLKKINDEHGHIKGDNCIKHMARIISGNIREEDVFFRYGGDEFIIGFVDIKRNSIVGIMERINTTIEELDSCNICRGVSYGIADDMERSIEEIIESADQNMYENKKYRKLRED